MTYDLSDFEEELGRELRAAAYRRIEARNSKTLVRRLSPVFGVLAGIVVVALAAVLIADIRPQPAAAHPFRVIYLDTEIRLEIVDWVKDPRAAEQELAEELGIVISLLAVPVPPELINEVGGAYGEGTTNVQVEFDDAGRSKAIVFPQRIDGKLTIEYGRESQSGERYAYTVASPLCTELWGQTPEESAARLSELDATIRYDMYDFGYNLSSDVSVSDINPEYRLVDATYLADDRLLVVYSANLDVLGDGCV